MLGRGAVPHAMRLSMRLLMRLLMRLMMLLAAVALPVAFASGCVPAEPAAPAAPPTTPPSQPPSSPPPSQPSSQPPVTFKADRHATLPAGRAKMTPAEDLFPPVLNSDLWQQPVPLPGPINTAGCEDSPFILPDGSEFYFFFTPDASIPVTQQVLDGITGIWVARREGGSWSEPERVVLCDDLSMDGCTFVQGDEMWFGSVRQGNLGEIDIWTARRSGTGWADWQNAGAQLNRDYDIGEFHLSADGNALYFSANRPGGYGGLDIWVSRRAADGWGGPENLGPSVNTAYEENQPFLTADGGELWYTGWGRAGIGPSALRALRAPEGGWAPAAEMVSNFAGEPCLDDQGNIYFVHHYMTRDMQIIEADIYVAYRK